MSPIRELLVILSSFAIVNARNNVDLAIQLMKPFNQQDFQQISWKYFTELEQYWDNLETPLSGATDSEINNFLTNVNKGYDNYGRSTDNLVRLCRTAKAMLPVAEKQMKLKQYNDQLGRQMNSFKQATDSLRVVLTNLEAGANNLNSIDIEAEKFGFKKYSIQDYNNGTVKLEVHSGYASAELNKLLNFLAGKSFVRTKNVYFFSAPINPTPAAIPNTFNLFEKKFNEVEKGVNSAANIIRDVIKKEDTIEGNNTNEDEPTFAIKMQRATFIVLLAGLFLAASVESDNSLAEKVNTINVVLKMYDQELDRVVPFKAIQNSISGLDIMSTNYNGECTNMIDKAGDLGHRATDNYYRGTDVLLRWSASAKRVLGFVLSRHDSITRDQIEKAVGTTINKGFKAFNESLGTLDTVVDQLGGMQSELEPIPDKLQAELKKIQEQHDEDVKNKRESGEFIKKGMQALSKLVTFVLEYVKVPDASKLDLEKELHVSGITDNIIEGKLIPDSDQKLKIVEAYYKALTETVLSATTNVTKVKDEFKNSFVDQLRPWTPDSYSSNNDDDDRSKDSNDSDTNKDNSGEKTKGSGEEGNTARIIEEVRKLMETLKQITERFDRSIHGSHKLQSQGGKRGDNKEGIIWPVQKSAQGDDWPEIFYKSGKGDNKEGLIYPAAPAPLKSGLGENKEGIFWPRMDMNAPVKKSAQGDDWPSKERNNWPEITVMAAEVQQVMDETAKEREEVFWRLTTARPSRRHTTRRY
ncbi:hypothetical protein WDU94_009431 [Cyamophila willieti]